MFERFTKDARALTLEAEAEAAVSGSRTIEAEHLLLALAARGTAGLDRDAIAQALEDEQRRSLAAVGVDIDGFDLPPVATVTKPKWGTSAKRALETTLRVALDRGEKRIGTPHMVLALLRFEAGTVPRALWRAEVDREALAAAADAELR